MILCPQLKYFYIPLNLLQKFIIKTTLNYHYDDENEQQILNRLQLPINQLSNYFLQSTMSGKEDFNKPRNLTDSLFRDQLDGFQLGQVSKITKFKKQEVPQQNVRQSKYKEKDEDDGDDDDFFGITLEAESNMIHRAKQQTSSNSTNSSQSTTPNTEQKKTASTMKRRGAKKQEKNKNQEKQKVAIDIDDQIGEVAEWAERGAKNNSDEDDFDNEDEKQVVTQTQQQIQARKRLQQKLKNGFGNNKKASIGLGAKAQQLRRQNQKKAEVIQIKQQPLKQDKIKSKKEIKDSKAKIQQQKNQVEDHNNSKLGLNSKKNSKKITQQQNMQQKFENEDMDDHWDRINNQTIKQKKDIEEKRKTMTLASVLNYFQKEFEFKLSEIDEQIEAEQNQEQEQQKGFFSMLCACFVDKKRPKKQTKVNVTLAKRLIAISKKQLTNTQQEVFVLRQIWVKLTKKQYSRYGSHWNEIGFQGRDPTTDLRSTGILSLVQWITFINDHPELSEKHYSWSTDNQYPLALTHIKITGVYLDLLMKGIIKSESWKGFQDSYNCLIMGMFQKMMENFKLGDTLGNFVEETAKEIKKDYKKLFAAYSSKKQAKKASTQ